MNSTIRKSITTALLLYAASIALWGQGQYVRWNRQQAATTITGNTVSLGSVTVTNSLNAAIFWTPAASYDQLANNFNGASTGTTPEVASSPTQVLQMSNTNNGLQTLTFTFDRDVIIEEFVVTDADRDAGRDDSFNFTLSGGSTFGNVQWGRTRINKKTATDYSVFANPYNPTVTNSGITLTAITGREDIQNGAEYAWWTNVSGTTKTLTLTFNEPNNAADNRPGDLYFSIKLSRYKAPILNLASTTINRCDKKSFNLNTLVAQPSIPVGGALKWYTDASLRTEVANPQSVIAGTYFVAYVDSATGIKGTAQAFTIFMDSDCDGKKDDDDDDNDNDGIMDNLEAYADQKTPPNGSWPVSQDTRAAFGKQLLFFNWAGKTLTNTNNTTSTSVELPNGVVYTATVTNYRALGFKQSFSNDQLIGGDINTWTGGASQMVWKYYSVGGAAFQEVLRTPSNIDGADYIMDVTVTARDKKTGEYYPLELVVFDGESTAMRNTGVTNAVSEFLSFTTTAGDFKLLEKIGTTGPISPNVIELSGKTVAYRDTEASQYSAMYSTIGVNPSVTVKINTGRSGGSGQAFGVAVRLFADTDGDGIPDAIDLDSDNDGCPDAIEGDERVRLDQLNTNTPNVNNTSINSPIDAAGVPVLVNAGGAADIGGDQGQGRGSSINANINVCQIDAIPDINQIPVGSTATGNVITNDKIAKLPLFVSSATYTDAQGAVVMLPIGTATLVYAATGAAAGTITLNADGSYTFVSIQGFVGAVQIPYTVQDYTGISGQTRLTIQVVGEVHYANDKPTAQNDVSRTKAGKPVSSNALANDSDPNKDPIRVQSAQIGNTNIPLGVSTQVSGTNINGGAVANAGSITIQVDGSYTYVPIAGFVGQVSPIDYTIIDGKNATDKAQIYIYVSLDSGNATYANDDANTGLLRMKMQGNVLVNDFDPETNPITVTSATAQGINIPITGVATLIPGHGMLSFSSDGSYVFIPIQGAPAQTTKVSYTICDNVNPPQQQACDKAILYLTTLKKAFFSCVRSNRMISSKAKR